MRRGIGIHSAASRAPFREFTVGSAIVRLSKSLAMSRRRSSAIPLSCAAASATMYSMSVVAVPPDVMRAAPAEVLPPLRMAVWPPPRPITTIPATVRSTTTRQSRLHRRHRRHLPVAFTLVPPIPPTTTTLVASSGVAAGCPSAPWRGIGPARCAISTPGTRRMTHDTHWSSGSNTPSSSLLRRLRLARPGEKQ